MKKLLGGEDSAEGKEEADETATVLENLNIDKKET